MNFSEAWLQQLGDARGAAARTDSLHLLGESYEHFLRGYGMDAAKIISDGRIKADAAVGQEITVAPLPFYSLCEHHLLPFFGTVSITYAPREWILGLGKFPRLVEALSARLTLQETLTAAIADTLFENLNPHSCRLTVEARHLCLEMRGAQTISTAMITIATRPASKK